MPAPVRRRVLLRSTPRLAVALGLAACLAGCLVVPLPMGEGEVTEGREVPVEPANLSALLGRSKAEVLALLGEPGAVWDERRVLVYAWDRIHLKLLWIVAGGYRAAGGIIDVPTHYLLLIETGDDGAVTRAERCVRPMAQRFGVFLREWADGRRCP